MANKNTGGIVGTVAALAEPIAAEYGLAVWDVRFVKEGADWILRVIIDREDEAVSIDDCVNVTRKLNPALDEADPIGQSYCLEVSSPGADRELIRPEHFAYYAGYPVTVRLYRPTAEGAREIAGVLEAYENGNVTLRTEDDTLQTIEKKDIAAVHAIDDFTDIGESDDTGDEE